MKQDAIGNRMSDKVVIVTGAAQGIGQAVAETVAKEGAHVVLTDIQSEKLETVAARLREQGLSVESHQLDVRNEAEFAAVAKGVAAEWDRIDGLVNNAGVNVKYPPMDMPAHEWDRCMDINLRGQWHGAKAVLPYMVKQGNGSIVNLSSVHGHQIVPSSFPYPVSKAGILGLTRALGVEYAAKGVRVNSVSPGYVETPLLTDWLQSQPEPDVVRREAERLIPARRFAKAREVGMTVLFLLTDEAAYINATDIAIDGGRLALFHY